MSGFWWNSICSSPVWNSHVSWNTTDPDFTPCFQKTVLYWIPCGFLFLAVPLHLVTVCKQNNTDAVPHSWLNLTKTILLTFLAAVCLADLFRWVHLENQDLLVDAADFLQSSCLLISFGLCLLCVQYGRMKGVRSTGVLFIFWLLLCICDIVVFRSKIRHAVFRGGVNDIFSFVTFTLHFVIVLVQLVLSCLMDRPPIGYNQSDRSSEENAPFLSRVTFWWFTGMVFTGYRRTLVDNDLCGLNEDDKCGNVAPVLRGHWKRELEKSKSKGATEDKNGSIEKGKEKESVPLKPMLDTEETGVEIKSGKQIYEPSLVKALARGFGPYFLSGSILKLVHDVMVFINPQILRLLIEFTTDKSQPRWLGFLYAGVMFISALFQSLILQQYFHRCTVTGMRIRGSLVAAVYRKSLRLSNSAKRKTTTGEIVNLMSVDAQRFMDLTTYINMVWSAPVQISIALYFLWQTLGPSVLAGLGVMILLMPINALLAHFTRKYQMAQMKHKDERIKLMNEILNGIKVLKLYAWEQSFMDRVLGIRSKELGILKKNAYLNGGITFAWNCAPFIVSLVTFAVYVLSSPDNVLDAQRAFVALSLFNILRFPLFALPMVISSCVQANVSIHRLTEFFKHEELENGAVTNFKQSGSALKITDGTFKWERSDSPILENINVDLKPGSLVAVVGSVGAGKSSLLSAALGDMEKCKGTINVDGSVAYVSQQAWIQNSTLRDNILFNQSYEDETYWKVMNACALKPDLEQLTSGDQTEIGEKGINLSGGQKQRVSLARAVYNNADIYLMDDPLSAVDAHVGKHIFENVIGPSGMLSDKTRILVTHGISFLPQVDLIIVLEDGQVKEMGSYNQLMDHAGPFAEFLRNYLEEEEEELSEMSDDEKSLRDEIIHNLEPIFGTIHHGSAMRLAGSKMSLHSNAQCLSNLSLHKLKSRESLHASLPRLQQLRSHESHGSRSPALKRQHSSRQNTEEKIIPKTDEEKDKLIVTETAETGTVKLAVFGTYIKAISIPVSLLILLLFALSYTAAIGQNIWLSDWSDEVTQNGGNITDARRDLRLAVYGALGLAQGIFDFLSAMSMAAGGIKASKHLHFKLLHRILHASYQFLERVTIGRILNRFTEDIADVDLVMPFTVRSVINTVLAAVGTVAIVTSTTPLFLCILPAAGIVYFIIQVLVIARPFI